MNHLGLKDYVVEQPNEGVDLVPRAVMPQAAGKPFALGKKTIRQIPAISGNSQTSAGGTSTIFSLGYGHGAGMLVNGSPYIKFTLEVPVTTGQASGGTWGFSASPVADASSLIQRATVMAGGANIEQVNQYWLYKSAIINPFFTNSSYSNVSSLMAGGVSMVNNLKPMPYDTANTSGTGANGVFTYNPNTFWKTAASNNQITICLPLALSIFNSTQGGYLPLELLSSPIQVQIDWNNAAQAFFSSSDLVSTYSVSDCSIVYETVACPESYYNSLRQAMASGKLYQLPLECCLTSQTQGGATVSYQLATSLSSVNAVFVGKIQSGDLGDSSKSKYFSASNNSTPYNGVDTAVTLRQLYFDGYPVWSGIPLVNSDQQLAAELLRAVTANTTNADYSWIIPSLGVENAVGSFRRGFYVRGFNCRNFAEEDLQATGMPVAVMNFQESDSNSSSSDQIYIFVVYSATAVIDGSGSLSIIR